MTNAELVLRRSNPDVPTWGSTTEVELLVPTPTTRVSIGTVMELPRPTAGMTVQIVAPPAAPRPSLIVSVTGMASQSLGVLFQLLSLLSTIVVISGIIVPDTIVQIVDRLITYDCTLQTKLMMTELLTSIVCGTVGFFCSMFVDNAKRLMRHVSLSMLGINLTLLTGYVFLATFLQF
jgi:hypothetical protein